MPKTISLNEAEVLLGSGKLDDLVGVVEDVHVECKGAPYQLTKEVDRMELAKDVSALANAKGGIILLGCRTEKVPTISGDVVAEIRPFSRDLVNPQDYLNVIKDWVYPGLEVEIDWFPMALDDTRGIIAMIVRERTTENRPFVVTKILDQSGKLPGTMLGYFERRRDTVPSTSVQELRDRLKDGIRFSAIDRRLENIEEMLSALKSKPTLIQPSLDPKALQKRIDTARLAVGLNGTPNYVLAAVPAPPTEIPSLFLSNSEVLQLLKTPPEIRQSGFDLDAGGTPEIVGAALRRSLIPGYKLLEFWQDGTLIFIARGDTDFLSWGNPSPSGRLTINSWVLVESALLFAQLLIKLMAHAVPTPAGALLHLILGNMTVNQLPCRLSRYAEKPNHYYDTPGKEAPEESVSVAAQCELGSAQSGIMAYLLLGKLYVTFGFDADKVPLVDYGVTPPAVNPCFITGERP